MSDDWREFAACVEWGGELFDLEGIGPAFMKQVRDAKPICDECPVREACLAYALQHHEMRGMWGGTTPRERAQILRGLT